MIPSVKPTKPSRVQSFAPNAGQSYIADLYTGYALTSKLSNKLFSFASTDTNVPLASLLTNLDQPGRIGSTMNFTAVQIGLRIFKVGDAQPTTAEIHDLIRYLGSLNMTVTLGDNKTRIAEFTGAHLLNQITFSAKDAGAEGAAASVPFNSTAWINLPEPIGIEDNLTLGGNVDCNLASVPASLIAVASSYAFMVVLAGRKQVK